MDPLDAGDLLSLLPRLSPARILFTTAAGMVAAWLVSRFLRENAPDMTGGSRWVVGGSVSLLVGYLADALVSAVAAHMFLAGIVSLAVAASSGTLAVGLAWPAVESAMARRRRGGKVTARAREKGSRQAVREPPDPGVRRRPARD